MKRFLSLIVCLWALCSLSTAQNAAPEWSNILSDQPERIRTQLISSSERSIQVNVQVPGFYTTNVQTPRGEAKVITMPRAISTAKAGEPNVPMTGIPVMIGDRARMNVRVIDAQYMDFEGIEVAPSKGDFSRQIDPATVPYTYGECYNHDAFFPASNLDLYEPYIIRDFRGQNMVVYPFAYNPVSKTLRVYYNMTVEMYKVDDRGANVMETRRSNTVKMDPDFKSVYQRHFINYEAGMAKYTPVDEEGDLLIICYDNFISSMTDFVNWKKTRGINTTIVGTSTAGNSSSAIQTYIRNQYNANNNLTHVLLVGDVAQIPGYTYSGASGYEGKGDNPYGQIVGNDIYNDVFIGRFSASSATQVTTQVNRTITYERDLTTSDTWCQNGLGISTTEGSGGHNNEDDYQHIEKLRTDLLNYSYSTVYQDYYNVNGYPSSSTTTISNHINSGVGIINYCNHGEETGWQSHYYMNANVNALTNNNKLPFIFSVACLVGKYDHSTECFAETWMHATNGNNPTGAIGGAFSYISQPWIPPMWAQDEFVDILCELKNNNIKRTLGGAMVNGMMAIFDNYSTSNASAVGTYQAWITYGDPTLMMRTKTPQAMTVTHNGNITLGTSTYTINVNNGNGAVATITDASHNILGKATVNNGTATVSLNSSNLTAGSQLTLCVFGYNKVTYLGTINVVGGTQYNITASVNPANSGTMEGAGQYYENTECTLTATANHGYAFDNWKQGNTVVSTEPTYTFTVTGNATYTANFHALTQHHLTYNPNQTNGTISVSPTDAYAGDIITLTATPAAGYCLDQWHVTTGRAEIPVVNNQFTMPDSDVTITATFKSGYTVTVATVANGTITANPTSAMPGDIITLTATPNTGCEFMAWNAYKTGDPNTAVTVFNNTIRMPSYDVTVSAVFATSTIADPITIGSGTSTNQYLPTYTYYNYSLTQQIYTAAELGEAGSITAIAFQVGNSKASTRNLSIYMRPTDLTAFSSTTGWETMGDVYLVYAGSVAFSASGWTTIQLDTPFKYDGVKNVNICVVDNSGSYDTNGNYPYFRVYSTGANRAMRVYNDNNAYSVGTSDQISTYTGTYVTSNNQIQITKKLVNAETITVTPTTIEGLSYVQGEGPSETKTVDVTGVDLSNDITVTAPTGFEISTTANGTYGTSLTIPRATSKGGRATQTWGFEGSLENWTTVDADGDTWGWVLGSAVGGVYLAEGSNLSEGHSGSDMMVSGSYSNVNGVLTPDNWLISPQVELGGTFSMWAKGQDASWFAEHFGIYVSTTNNSISSFQALNEWTLSSGEWKQYSVDLSFFAGQTGYIAIRHFNCTNMFMIDVDDFELNTEASFTPDLPVVITPATVYVRLQDGLDPDTYSGNMTFVAGSVNATVALNGEVLPGSGEQYTVTVEASPANGGTVAGGGTFYEGTHHNLTATPAAHYTFTGWQLNGSIVSTDNPYNITVTGDATYTAVFTEMSQYNVTLNQVEGGTITANPTTAYPGDVVTLTVSENSGYFFVEWNVVDTNNQTVTVTNNQFTMPESDVTVTAVFTSGFEVTLVQTEHGTISADKTTALQPGERVTLTATPDNGCVLLAWYAYKTGDPRAVVSVINNEFFLMPSSDVTVQAIFVTEEEHEAQLGSGTNTNQYIPTYVRANYSLTQQIYTASELGNQNGRITKIAYYGYSSSGQTAAATRNLTIYIAHTDKSTFSSGTDWEVMGSVAKVFEGNVTFSRNAWATITLNTPFEYDGTSNINICVVDNTGSTSGSNQRYIQFYRYNGTNRAIYANGSSSYANIVGYSDQLSSTSGTRISYVNRINITMMVPGSAESLTISPDEINDFSYVEGQGPSATNKLGIVGVDLSNDISLTAPANFEISLTENGTYSNSLTIARETGSKGNRNVTQWGFEGTMDGWTAVDADGDGYNWVLGSACSGVYLEGNLTEGHDGSGDMMVSGSWTNVASTALTPDNWLISPQVELGGSFSLWAQPQQSSYPAEHFGIYVSTTGTNASDFTLLNEWTLSAPTWKQFSVDLSVYTGLTGYIAVRHFNCTDQFMIKLDDFVLDTDAAITVEMPVTITPATVYVRMAAGLEQGTYSGTLNAAAGNDFTGSVSLAGEVIFPSFVKNILGFGDVTNPGGYYLIASPIGQVAPTNVTNMLEETYDLYYFDQDTDGNGNEWINYRGDANVSHAGFSLEPGIGYLYANSNTVDLTFTGRPIAQSSYTVTLEKHDDARFAGWNLVGNPFAQTAWVDTDHNAYYTMNGAGTAFIGVTSNSVEAMEGIFVRANSDEEEISFTTIDPNAKCSSLALNLSQGNGLMDRATVRFDEGCQLPKLQFNRNSSKVYIPMDSEDYAVVRGEEIGEMPINFKAESNGTYNLCLSTDNVEFAYLHLVDNLTGNDVDLLQTPSYSFEAKTTDYESRFKLVFATGDNGNDDNFAFFSNGSFVINNDGKATLQVIDVTGRVLKSETINGCANVSVNGAAGVYMLRLINGDNMKVQKVVVK